MNYIVVIGLSIPWVVVFVGVSRSIQNINHFFWSTIASMIDPYKYNNPMNTKTPPNNVYYVAHFVGVGRSIQNMDAIAEMGRCICGVVVFSGSLCSPSLWSMCMLGMQQMQRSIV